MRNPIDERQDLGFVYVDENPFIAMSLPAVLGNPVFAEQEFVWLRFRMINLDPFACHFMDRRTADFGQQFCYFGTSFGSFTVNHTLTQNIVLVLRPVVLVIAPRIMNGRYHVLSERILESIKHTIEIVHTGANDSSASGLLSQAYPPHLNDRQRTGKADAGGIPITTNNVDHHQYVGL